jgi:peptide/nickel transport system permease protein
MSRLRSWLTARRRISGGLAATALVVLAILAAAAPIVAPYAPEELDLANRRAGPSTGHWFGTDELGRDLLSRVLFGARVTLAVGLLSALVAAAVGIGIGALTGYAGGLVDAVLMRVTDAMLAVPRLPLLMIAGAVLAPSVPMLIVLIGLAGWMETARLVRAEFLSLREREFVDAARTAGATGWRIVFRHLLPNAAPSIMVSITLAVGRGMLLESALSFFGVGVQPPTPSWGNMLYQAQTTMSTEPWLALFPGLCIFLTALGINVVGESLVAPQSPSGVRG